MAKAGRRCAQVRAARGFTLIEVLVVVAIIALLISILLPSLRKSRDNVKCVVCKTNLHDLGLGCNMYAAASNAWYPLTPYIGSNLWVTVDNPAADDNLFVLWFSKYLPDVKTFNCPATTHKIRTPSRIVRVPTAYGVRFDIYTAGSTSVVNDFERLGQYDGTGGHGTSYKWGGWYSTPGTTVDINRWWHVAKYKLVHDASPYRANVGIRPPFKQVLLNDADDSDSMARSYGFKGITNSNGMALNNIPEPWDNHGSVMENYLYADGHVVTQKDFTYDHAH